MSDLTNISHRRAIEQLRRAGYSQCTRIERLPWHPIRMPSCMDRRCYVCGETIPAGIVCWFETPDQAAHTSCYDKAEEKIA